MAAVSPVFRGPRYVRSAGGGVLRWGHSSTRSPTTKQRGRVYRRMLDANAIERRALQLYLDKGTVDAHEMADTLGVSTKVLWQTLDRAMARNVAPETETLRRQLYLRQEACIEKLWGDVDVAPRFVGFKTTKRTLRHEDGTVEIEETQEPHYEDAPGYTAAQTILRYLTRQAALYNVDKLPPPEPPPTVTVVAHMEGLRQLALEAHGITESAGGTGTPPMARELAGASGASEAIEVDGWEDEDEEDVTNRAQDGVEVPVTHQSPIPTSEASHGGYEGRVTTYDGPCPGCGAQSWEPCRADCPAVLARLANELAKAQEAATTKANGHVDITRDEAIAQVADELGWGVDEDD